MTVASPGDPFAVPPRRRGRLVAAVLATAVVAGGVGWVVAGGTDAPVAAAADTGPSATATVTSRDIITTTTLDGTLTYADAATLAAGLTGTVTWVPEVGAVIGFGQTLYEVDGAPVVLLPGRVPAWRDLQDGMEDGDDVEVLEQALLQLGYPEVAGYDLTVDREFTSVTAAVVAAFREDVGLSEIDSGDDSLALGEFAYTPDLVRVAGVQVTLGDRVSVGTPVLSTTTPERVVTIALDAADQGLVATGDAVEVELPDGVVVPAEVTSVSGVARAVTTTGQNAETTYVLDVEVTLTEGGDGFDEAPVSIDVVESIAEGVLTVPVGAVVALAEGGYALEVVEGDATRLIAVTLGSFSDGVVEVSGPDVVDGLVVVSA